LRARAACCAVFGALNGSVSHLQPFVAIVLLQMRWCAMLNLLQHIAENQNVLPHISSRALRGHSTEKGKILSL
jgi:hypothetical protein